MWPPVGTSGAARALTVDAAIVRRREPRSRRRRSRCLATTARRARWPTCATRASSTAARPRLTEGWSQLVYGVGRDLQTARAKQSLREQSRAQAEALRDQVSGVSLDEEAMKLMKFQRAYEANARFFRVIDQTLDILFITVAGNAMRVTDSARLSATTAGQA